ncbi:MAG: beta-galactosidase [Verrucomicrobia bacterium]|nr:beta-galactosidase [Verrucomicrobiota bacterium]
MYFGADYHPEHWVHPYDGTEEEPEARWLRDAQLMKAAGMNVVRMGEFCWGLYEPEEGRYRFDWMRRVMDIMKMHDIQVVLATPTAAPPVWLARKHPEILPVDENGLVLHEGTRHAYSMNSDVYWEYTRKIVTELAKALGDHPQLIAWQIDNGIGGHGTEFSFNEETRRDWHAWLRQKYGTVENLNNALGLRFWGQVVARFEEVPMPMRAPTVHNPALILDWMRFASDTAVAYVGMQAELLHELTPNVPVTTNLRALSRHYDHFDMAGTLDFVALDSYATMANRPAENAVEFDIMRSLKKGGVRTPDGQEGFWVIEQKAGNVNWQDVNSLLRPGVVRLFTYQLISRGATGALYFFWRSPRIGSEKFYGGVLGHDGDADNRVYREISQIGEEIKLLGPILKDTKVEPEVCILFSHENVWALKFPMQPTKYFHQWDHVMRFYRALHDRNIPVDFARPTDDLSRYKLVIAPSLHLLAGGEADLLKLYVQNGGTLVGTFNTGLVDEHNIAPRTGCPHDLTDLFGLEVEEFDPRPPDEENHLIFRGSFPASHAHCAKIWCDIITPRECETLATYSRDFYAGKPAFTINEFGLGKAVYIGFMSDQAFYSDLADWLRQLCGLFPLLRVPESVEVSMRRSKDRNIYFLLNHQKNSVRLHFYKPMHEYLTGTTLTGNYDLPPLGVLVLDEKAPGDRAAAQAEEREEAIEAQSS